MTDADLDARVQSLPDEDLQDLVTQGWCRSRVDWYRSLALTKRLAAEVLRLRKIEAAAKELNEEFRISDVSTFYLVSNLRKSLDPGA